MSTISPEKLGLNAINAALADLPDAMGSDAAVILLLAIGLQESKLVHRRQLIERDGNLVAAGPAKSFWQGERLGGMTAGILRHNATSGLTRALCSRHGIAATPTAIWHAIKNNDVLAASCARLLLWTDPAPLPGADRRSDAFRYYVRTWRPGAYTQGSLITKEALMTKFLRNHFKSSELVQP